MNSSSESKYIPACKYGCIFEEKGKPVTLLDKMNDINTPLGMLVYDTRLMLGYDQQDAIGRAKAGSFVWQFVSFATHGQENSASPTPDAPIVYPADFAFTRSSLRQVKRSFYVYMSLSR